MIIIAKIYYPLQPTEPYISETEELDEESEGEDELEEEVDEDEDDDEDDEKEVGLEDMEALWQASKSTKRDHFSKLQKRLRQLGKMFINQVSYGWPSIFVHNLLPGNNMWFLPKIDKSIVLII